MTFPSKRLCEASATAAIKIEYKAEKRSWRRVRTVCHNQGTSFKLPTMFKLSSQLCSWLNEAAQPFSEDNTFLIIEAEAPANFEGGIYRIISRGQIVDREGESERGEGRVVMRR